MQSGAERGTYLNHRIKYPPRVALKVLLPDGFPRIFRSLFTVPAHDLPHLPRLPVRI
jgi:hypothetical protein